VLAGFFINSNNNTFSGNLFSNNHGGLLFVACEENNIIKNSFQTTYINLAFETSSSNHISNNNFKYKFLNINRNILSFQSNNKWVGNFWNRPRLLPVLIWNFKIKNFGFLPISPTFPDIDWRPAKKPNDINGEEHDRTELGVNIPGNIVVYNTLFKWLFNRISMREVIISRIMDL
jgi:parallel beta-helix repeat protein